MSEETKTVDENEITEDPQVQEEEPQIEEETQEENSNDEELSLVEQVLKDLEEDKTEEETKSEEPKEDEQEEETAEQTTPEVEDGLPEWVNGIQPDPHDSEFVVTAQGDRIKRELAEDAMNWVEKRDYPEWIKKSYDEMSPEEVIAKKWGQREGFGFYNKQKQEQQQETGILTKSGEKAYEEWKNSNVGKRLQKILDQVDPPETKAEKKQQKSFEDSINELAEKYDNGDITRDQFLTEQTQMVKEHLNAVESEITNKVLQQVEAKTAEKEKANEFNSWFEQSKKEGDELAKNDPRYREAAIENVGEDGMTPVQRIMFTPALNANGEVEWNRNRNPMTGKYYTAKTAWNAYLKLASDDGNGSSKRLSFTEQQAMPPVGTPPKDAEEPELTEEQLAKMDLKDVLKFQGKKLGFWKEY